MQSRPIAQIAVRIVSIFLLWRAVEFGVSNFIGVRYQMRILTPPTDQEMKEAFRSMENVTMMSTLVPVVLAILLWILAPRLSQLMVYNGETDLVTADSRAMRSTLLQIAGLVFVGLAAVMLPQIIYGLYTDRLRNPTVTFVNSSAFTYATQFFGKFIVGSFMLLASKRGSRL